MTDKGGPRVASGRIALDPASELSVGDEIHFRLVSMGSSSADRVPSSVDNWGFFKGALAGLVLASAHSSSMIGTAVIVAPGVAITATHNLIHEAEPMKAGKVVPYCLAVRDDGLDIWKAANINYSEETDVAFLSLEAVSPLPLDRTYYLLGITTRALMIGEELNVVGYRAEEWTTPSPNRHEVSGALYTARGMVTNVYPEGRDKLLIPYPAIELDCGALGGMSGGAAIDRNGLRSRDRLKLNRVTAQHMFHG